MLKNNYDFIASSEAIDDIDILPILDVFKDWNISVEDVFACLNFS